MKTTAAVVFILALASVAMGAGQAITINLVTTAGVGKEIGQISVSDTRFGLLIRPELSDLPPGIHGFHVHENPSCTPAMKDNAMAAAHSAGSHIDPGKTNKHDGPYGEGHLGDLPALFVTADGKATQPVLAPRLKVSDLTGHSVIIHAGGDNYSNQPDPLGGGGGRIACGVVK